MIGLLLEFLFPSSCPGCGREFCQVCPEHSIEQQRLTAAGRCPRCYSETDGACRRCARQTFYFDAHRSLYAYTGSMKQLIGRWKFENHRPSGRLFLPDLTGALLELQPDRAGAIDSARRLRSFKPALDLLKSARQLKIPCGIDIGKKRIARTRKQSQRNKAGRYFEVRDSLELLRDLSRVKHYVLLDDVFTTGATANEAARLLKSCGVEKVSVLTVAMREEPEFDSNGADITANRPGFSGFDSTGQA